MRVVVVGGGKIRKICDVLISQIYLVLGMLSIVLCVKFMK